MTGLWDRILVVAQKLWAKEEGQDLVEYALVVALLAFGAIAGMRTFSDAIVTEFFQLGFELQAFTTVK